MCGFCARGLRAQFGFLGLGSDEMTCPIGLQKLKRKHPTPKPIQSTLLHCCPTHANVIAIGEECNARVDWTD
eukprot:8451921-Lingulodinium_polyedra.AAC.1